MAHPKILQAGQSYTFRSYFEMPYETDDILAEFGYGFQAMRLDLPHNPQVFPHLASLKQDLEETLELTRLSSETARREVLVSPVLLAVARWMRCQVRVEYPVQVSDFLKGSLDYLLLADRQLLVVEAKGDDLVRGFNQLAIEMIALSEDRDLDVVYGAITIGDVWRFGRLDRPQKMIVQDITLYKIPDELDILVAILSGILQG